MYKTTDNQHTCAIIYHILYTQGLGIDAYLALLGAVRVMNVLQHAEHPGPSTRNKRAS